jgi:hypothetical protein
MDHQGVKSIRMMAQLLGMNEGTLGLRMRRPATLRLGELDRIFTLLKAGPEERTSVLDEIPKGGKA